MTNQMETILQALQQQGAALQLLIQQNQQPAIQAPTISQTMMSHNITFESFNPDEESFSTYKERLETFFTLRQLKENAPGVAEAKLLNCLKSKQYQLLSSLTAPDKPGEKSYDQLKTLDVALTMEAARKQNLEEYSKDANSGTINKIQIDLDLNFDRVVQNLMIKINDLVIVMKNNHVAAECRSKSKLECSSCKKKGHLAKVCISTMLKQKKQITDDTVNNIDESYDDYSINSIQYIDILSSEDRELCKKITIKLQLNGQDQEFELDSGRYKISKNGLEKDPAKVEAVVNAPQPKNVNDVRSFIGMALYYSSFIPNASKILYPLNQLLRKDAKFHCDRILIPFQSESPIVLETDASPYGLATILSHRINGENKPIAFISRTLTAAEKNYSHIDKEATAIYWSVKKFFQYLYGTEFILVTDNKPLQSIFNPEKQLPSITALRLTRYALFLRQFQYKIQHRSGKQHQNVDYFSRAPVLKSNSREVDETYVIHEVLINQISTSSTITAERIRLETTKDPELVKLKLPPALVPAEQTPIAPGPITSELDNDPVTPAFNGNYPEPTQTQPPEEVEVRREINVDEFDLLLEAIPSDGESVVTDYNSEEGKEIENLRIGEEPDPIFSEFDLLSSSNLENIIPKKDFRIAVAVGLIGAAFEQQCGRASATNAENKQKGESYKKNVIPKQLICQNFGLREGAIFAAQRRTSRDQELFVPNAKSPCALKSTETASRHVI
ncbi:hypothetical protein ILUMI_11504 [Ignelater luminosus]|uniref:Reverse transcriptase RNase H-like domain-containing protein n=1 Tax=Ignelater luminosus TaxID=2038154 RepID=A0A8K0D4V6_IGNLU|nr:hypothetical protein ILUMI_11504 [Ignelater luminosus]